MVLEEKTYLFNTPEAMAEHAKAMWEVLDHSSGLIFLSGDLGVGKSTWVRAFLKAAGVKEAVTSPTYTLMEPYQAGSVSFMHCDFYRLASAEAVYDLGLDSYLDQSIVCVEWPEVAKEVLPTPDLWCHLTIEAQGHAMRVERFSPWGKALV